MLRLRPQSWSIRFSSCLGLILQQTSSLMLTSMLQKKMSEVAWRIAYSCSNFLQNFGICRILSLIQYRISLLSSSRLHTPSARVVKILADQRISNPYSFKLKLISSVVFNETRFACFRKNTSFLTDNSVHISIYFNCLTAFWSCLTPVKQKWTVSIKIQIQPKKFLSV